MKKVFIILIDILLLICSFLAPYVCSALIRSETVCYFWKKGILCPSCGGTRCAYFFFTGNFKQALFYNFAVFCGLSLGVFLILLLNVYAFLKNERCIKIIRFFLRPTTLISLAVAYVLFGLFRNFV